MNIFNRFTTERKLGEGTFSVTYLAHSRSGEKVAVKHIQKDRVKEEDWVNELEILRALQKHPHPNIVTCLDIFEDDKNVYIVEELLPHGDLLQYLTKHAPLKEAEIKKIFWTVLSAVEHLHSLKIVHRDIKLENLLFDPRGRIKLIDFNLSSFYTEKNLLTRYCGSLPYCPPEMVLRAPYMGPEVDVWSLGVLLYLLLFVRYPFPVDDERDIENLRKFMTNMLSARYTIPAYHPYSTEVVHLLQIIFKVDRTKRCSLSEIMNHPWLSTVREEARRKRLKKNLFDETMEKMERNLSNVSIHEHRLTKESVHMTVSHRDEVKSVVEKEESQVMYSYESATRVAEPTNSYVSFRPFFKNGITA